MCVFCNSIEIERFLIFMSQDFVKLRIRPMAKSVQYYSCLRWCPRRHLKLFFCFSWFLNCSSVSVGLWTVLIFQLGCELFFCFSWFVNCSRGQAEEILTSTKKLGTVLMRANSRFPVTGNYVISFRRELEGCVCQSLGQNRVWKWGRRRGVQKESETKEVAENEWQRHR